jgi:hypothetical protein
MESEHLNLVKQGDLISVISYNNFIKSDEPSQIKITGKKLIIKIINWENENDIKYFLASGEEDSNVTKGTMAGKATDSSFVTIRFNYILDHQGIPYYTSKTTADMVISGEKINYLDHNIQRFQILYEIKHPKKVIAEDKKKLNFWIPIDKDDLKKLGINNKDMLKHILKIDITRLDKDILDEKKFHEIKATDDYPKTQKYNVEKNIKKDFQIMMKDFFSFLTYTSLTKPSDLILSSNRPNIFFKIYNFYKNNDKQNILNVKEKNIKEDEFKQEIKDNIKANKIYKKEANFLKQYSGKYIIVEE